MMMRRFLPFAKDERGTAIVELALAAPILAVLVMGITDASTAFSRKLELEQGAQRAIEKQMQTTGNNTPEGTIKSEAAVQAGVDEANVTVTYVRLCDGTAQTNFATPCANTQRTALYLTVRVVDDYTPTFPLFSLGTKQANGTYRIVAKAGIRTQ
jgi:Flp pilus assembly protein TadG